MAHFGVIFLTFLHKGRKFRDEARPRAGLLRGREFLMKDLYTFDATEEAAAGSYEEVKAAYKQIFDRIGLPYLVVRIPFLTSSGKALLLGDRRRHRPKRILATLEEAPLMSSITLLQVRGRQNNCESALT